jgi:hypothetical protein
MNLYLISQNENTDYDTFDSAVVAAPDEETARNIHPYYFEGLINWKEKKNEQYKSWAYSKEAVKVVLIGKAISGTLQGVICASFNAG